MDFNTKKEENKRTKNNRNLALAYDDDDDPLTSDRLDYIYIMVV